MNCAQVVNFDEIITAKDSEMERLKARVSELEASLGRAPAGPATPAVRPPMLEAGASDGPAPLLPYAMRTTVSTPVRRGKAPPVGGEDPECLYWKIGCPLSSGLASGMAGQKRSR